MRLNSWTAEEDQILRDHYLSAGIDNCLKMLPNRTVASVRTRASTIGCSAPRGGNLWTAERVANLKRWWADGVTSEGIAGSLGCSAQSVRLKAKRLNLSYRGPGWTPAKRSAPRPTITKEPECPDMAPHPFWTPTLDRRVWDTRGLYRKMSDLANEIGKTACAVQQRWHRLNAEV